MNDMNDNVYVMLNWKFWNVKSFYKIPTSAVFEFMDRIGLNNQKTEQLLTNLQRFHC